MSRLICCRPQIVVHVKISNKINFMYFMALSMPLSPSYSHLIPFPFSPPIPLPIPLCPSPLPLSSSCSLPPLPLPPARGGVRSLELIDLMGPSPCRANNTKLIKVHCAPLWDSKSLTFWPSCQSNAVCCKKLITNQYSTSLLVAKCRRWQREHYLIILQFKLQIQCVVLTQN